MHEQHDISTQMISPGWIACSNCNKFGALPASWGVWRSIFIGDTKKPMDAQQLWQAAHQYGRTKPHG